MSDNEFVVIWVNDSESKSVSSIYPTAKLARGFAKDLKEVYNLEVVGVYKKIPDLP